MENRGFDGFGDIGAVATGARILWAGGEADLVIDDDMNGAASTVASKLRKVEYFSNDALPCNCGIAVNENG